MFWCGLMSFGVVWCDLYIFWVLINVLRCDCDVIWFRVIWCYFIQVWLDWSGFVLVWCGLVWFGDWTDLKQKDTDGKKCTVLPPAAFLFAFPHARSPAGPRPTNHATWPARRTPVIRPLARPHVRPPVRTFAILPANQPLIRHPAR